MFSQYNLVKTEKWRLCNTSSDIGSLTKPCYPLNRQIAVFIWNGTGQNTNNLVEVRLAFSMYNGTEEHATLTFFRLLFSKIDHNIVFHLYKIVGQMNGINLVFTFPKPKLIDWFGPYLQHGLSFISSKINYLACSSTDTYLWCASKVRQIKFF